MDKFVTFFTDLALRICGDIEQLAVVLVSFVPLIELKGSIAAGVKWDMSLGESFLYAYLGSTILCIPLYFIFKLLFKWKPFHRIEVAIRNKGKALFTKTEKLENEKASPAKITFYKCLGIFIFVAVPLPLTGVYTGTLLAVIVGLKFRWTLLSVVAGNAVAGGLITLLLSLFSKPAHVDYFLFALFAVAVVLLVVFLYKLIRQKPIEEKTETTPTDVTEKN